MEARTPKRTTFFRPSSFQARKRWPGTEKPPTHISYPDPSRPRSLHAEPPPSGVNSLIARRLRLPHLARKLCQAETIFVDTVNTSPYSPENQGRWDGRSANILGRMGSCENQPGICFTSCSGLSASRFWCKASGSSYQES